MNNKNDWSMKTSLAALAGITALGVGGIAWVANSSKDQPATVSAIQEDTAACDSPMVKGNVSATSGEKIYHMPGDRFYEVTKIDSENGERWFCTPEEAEDAGWRRSER